MGALAPLVGEAIGVERATIEVRDDGLVHSVRVGDSIDFEIEDVVPFGVETGEPVRFSGMGHPVASNLTMAERSAPASTPSDLLRGQDRVVDVRVFLGRLTPMGSSAAPRESAGLAPAYAAARARLGLVAALFVVATLGWIWAAHEMQGMDAGPWTSLGTLGWFLTIWVVMMAAMMLPSVAPTIALYAKVTRESSPLSPWPFTGGYLLTWAGAGLVAYVVGLPVTSGFGEALNWDHAGRAVAAATLVVAAVYEVTPLKKVCLAKCRSPLDALLGSWRGGHAGAVRMGMRNACLVRRVLLGAHGLTIRAGCDEHDLDGVRGSRDRGGEDPPVASRPHLCDGRHAVGPRHSPGGRTARAAGPDDPFRPDDADGLMRVGSTVEGCVAPTAAAAPRAQTVRARGLVGLSAGRA